MSTSSEEEIEIKLGNAFEVEEDDDVIDYEYVVMNDEKAFSEIASLIKMNASQSLKNLKSDMFDRITNKRANNILQLINTKTLQAKPSDLHLVLSISKIIFKQNADDEDPSKSRFVHNDSVSYTNLNRWTSSFLNPNTSSSSFDINRPFAQSTQPSKLNINKDQDAFYQWVDPEQNKMMVERLRVLGQSFQFVPKDSSTKGCLSFSIDKKELYSGDCVTVKGFLYKGSDIDKVNKTIDLDKYLTFISELKTKDKVKAYFHSYHNYSNNDFVVTSVESKHIVLKNANNQTLKFNIERLNENICTLGKPDGSPSFAKSLLTNTNVMFFYERNVNDEAQLLDLFGLCSLSDAERFYLHQSSPLYNLDNLIHDTMHCTRLNNLKKHVESSLLKLQKPKRKASKHVKKSVKRNYTQAFLDFDYPYQQFVDTPLSRMSFLMNQGNMSFLLMLKSLKHHLKTFNTTRNKDLQIEPYLTELKTKLVEKEKINVSQHTYRFGSFIELYNNIPNEYNPDAKAIIKHDNKSIKFVHAKSKSRVTWVQSDEEYFVKYVSITDLVKNTPKAYNPNKVAFIMEKNKTLFFKQVAQPVLAWEFIDDPRELATLYDKFMQHSLHNENDITHLKDLIEVLSTIPNQVDIEKTLQKLQLLINNVKRDVYFEVTRKEVSHQEITSYAHYQGDQDYVSSSDEATEYGTNYTPMMFDDETETLEKVVKTLSGDELETYIHKVLKDLDVKLDERYFKMILDTIKLAKETSFAKLKKDFITKYANLPKTQKLELQYAQEFEKLQRNALESFKQKSILVIAALVIIMVQIALPEKCIDIVEEYRDKFFIESYPLIKTNTSLIDYISLIIELYSKDERQPFNLLHNIKRDKIKGTIISIIDKTLQEKPMLQNALDISLSKIKDGQTSNLTRNLTNQYGTWSTFRPTLFVKNENESNTSSERVDDVTRFLDSLNKTLNDLPVFSSSYATPSYKDNCCNQIINENVGYWEIFERDEDFKKINKKISKISKNKHKQKVHDALFMDKRIVKTKDETFIFNEISIAQDETNVQSVDKMLFVQVEIVKAISSFVQNNSLFKDDEQLQMLMTSYTNPSSWNDFSENVTHFFTEYKRFLHNLQLNNAFVDKFVNTILHPPNTNDINKLNDVFYKFFYYTFPDIVFKLSNGYTLDDTSISLMKYLPLKERYTLSELIFSHPHKDLLSSSLVFKDLMKLEHLQFFTLKDSEMFYFIKDKNVSEYDVLMIYSYILIKSIIALTRVFQGKSDLTTGGMELDDTSVQHKDVYMMMVERMFSSFFTKFDYNYTSNDEIHARYEQERELRKQKIMKTLKYIDKEARENAREIIKRGIMSKDDLIERYTDLVALAEDEELTNNNANVLDNLRNNIHVEFQRDYSIRDEDNEEDPNE